MFWFRKPLLPTFSNPQGELNQLFIEDLRALKMRVRYLEERLDKLECPSKYHAYDWQNNHPVKSVL